MNHPVSSLAVQILRGTRNYHLMEKLENRLEPSAASGKAHK